LARKTATRQALFKMFGFARDSCNIPLGICSVGEVEMGMKLRVALVAAMAMTSVPAHALNIGDLAKTVLGNGATVQKAAENCPKKVTLTSQDSLTMQIARQAAEQLLPEAQFLALDAAATTQATTQAAKPGFCNQTAKKKNGLLDAIKRAGQQLITRRVLGL
jgi:hypothetical protein